MQTFSTPFGIAGGGLMGCSAAAAFLRVRTPVLLYDSSPEACAAAPTRLTEELAGQLSGGQLPGEADRREAAKRVETLLTVTENPADLNRADVILETIVEKSKVKQKFYRSLDPFFDRPKLLLSNTSTIRITELATALNGTKHLSPENFCGFHFFHPVRKRSLVELIRGEKTIPETIRRAEDLARLIEKEPIVAGDGPGFLVNRLLNPYLEEAMTLLLEGVPLERIEVACGRFGMEMGPFRIMDEIGLDVTMHSGWTFFKAFPQYIRSGDLLPALIASGRLGRKNGRGFKLYDGRGNWSDDGAPDPTLEPLLADLRKRRTPPPAAESAPDSPLGISVPLSGPTITDETLTLRIFCSILTEARRTLADGIIKIPSEADRALVRGLGFPAAKGGIFPWAESQGLDRLRRICREFEKLNPKYVLT
ncbi:MAG: 3-hydroxyacyl-CoA dehydrogenase NAD-binding domain-containing protein [Thermoguttaceae bacterium]|jgi:3-hydroxyacyl-CoA dehydrogenase